jgi:hypothetical protein
VGIGDGDHPLFLAVVLGSVCPGGRVAILDSH